MHMSFGTFDGLDKISEHDRIGAVMEGKICLVGDT
jgi:hypothetical protein